jgi:hypothetical protein
MKAGMNRTAAGFACLMILTGLVRCERNGSPLRPGGGTSDLEADYEVYRALLSDTTRVPCPIVALRDSTAAWPMSGEDIHWLRERVPEASEETVTSYTTRNVSPVPLRGFRCPGRSILFLDTRSSWDWERAAPGGCGAVTVSRAGFNRDGTEALVYWSVYWAPLAAYGSLILLGKKNGEWVVMRDEMIWIS